MMMTLKMLYGLITGDLRGLGFKTINYMTKVLQAP